MIRALLVLALSGGLAPPPALAAEPGPAPANPPDDIRARVRARLAALEGAQQEIIAAERGLADAKRRLSQGEEPLPGERLGTAGGRSRLAPAYFERQRALEDEVRAAQARLDAAYAAKNALR